jgi:hypothetical protein
MAAGHLPILSANTEGQVFAVRGTCRLCGEETHWGVCPCCTPEEFVPSHLARIAAALRQEWRQSGRVDACVRRRSQSIALLSRESPF